MFANSVYLNQQMITESSIESSPTSVRAAKEALNLYNNAELNARISRVWSWISKSSRSLLELSGFVSEHQVNNRFYAGIKNVRISQIQGTESRSSEFDKDFQPLHLKNRDRWVRIAEAMLKGITLPAVELIQVGDIYFVRDGHHRISVARCLGQKDIDAEVTVWETERYDLEASEFEMIGRPDPIKVLRGINPNRWL